MGAEDGVPGADDANEKEVTAGSTYRGGGPRPLETGAVGGLDAPPAVETNKGGADDPNDGGASSGAASPSAGAVGPSAAGADVGTPPAGDGSADAYTLDDVLALDAADEAIDTPLRAL